MKTSVLVGERLRLNCSGGETAGLMETSSKRMELVALIPLAALIPSNDRISVGIRAVYVVVNSRYGKAVGA